jgi:hypothetical protein
MLRPAVAQTSAPRSKLVIECGWEAGVVGRKLVFVCSFTKRFVTAGNSRATAIVQWPHQLQGPVAVLTL